MEFKAKEAKLTDVFDNGSYEQFAIPSYQRSYVWSQDEIENFWNDFIKRDSETSLHLIGSLIISKTPKTDKRFNVVDGQQRLITCSLLLAAIRDIWGEYFGIDEAYFDLHRYLVKTMRDKDLLVKILVADSIRNVYEDIVVHKTEGKNLTTNNDTKAIGQAYTTFREKIVQEIISSPKLREDDRKSLLWGLTDNLFDINCVLVVLESEDDAYEVFEGFNARGVDLSIADLFKNLILSRVKGDESKQENALLKWNEINQVVKELGIPKFNINTFLRYFWIGEHAYVGERELYKRIKRETTDYGKLLADLHKAALSLQIIFSNDPFAIRQLLSGETRYSDRINNSIRGLRAMNTQSYLVWLMALLKQDAREHISSKWVAISLERIENFCFRYFAVSKQPANKIEKEFAKLARSLASVLKKSDEGSIQTVVLNDWSKLVSQEKLLPAEEQFMLDFDRISLQSNNKPLIRYLLTRVEESYGTKEKKVDQQAVNIEHILPQKPGVEWNMTGIQLKENVNRLGNLTILLEKFNSSMSNKPINQKAIKIAESELTINQKLVDHINKSGNVWTSIEIDVRQKELAKLANKIWEVPLNG